MRKGMMALAVMACFLLSGCRVFEKKQQAGAAVEVNGHYLYRSTLDSLTLGMRSEDSLRVTQQYINQWAKDMLMYEAAKQHTTPEIERLVEDYRHSLYAQAYEEYLVERRMPKGIPDSTIHQVYMQMPDRFILDESIVQGMLVVIPNDAPKADKLRQWMEKESLDEIEKYAYQNALGYELFTDRWLTTSELMTQIPMERTVLENVLKSKNQIETVDTLKTYILQITDKHLRGSQMPLEYARPQIEKLILSSRQVDFLQKERERLYNEALQEQKIRFYEK